MSCYDVIVFRGVTEKNKFVRMSSKCTNLFQKHDSNKREIINPLKRLNLLNSLVSKTISLIKEEMFTNIKVVELRKEMRI